MKHDRNSRLRTGLLAFTAAAAVAAATLAHSANDAPGEPNLDAIKALAGSWVSLDEAGHPTDEVALTYRVTAGGSAVLETEFPGSEHEMLTVFTMNKGTLELQHYCMLGNAPHMVARAGEEPGEIIFDCDDKGGNMSCATDRHMHHGHYRFPSRDRISSSWKMIEKGEVLETAEFELARKPD